MKKKITGRLATMGVPALLLGATLTVLMAAPAFAANDELTTVIDNLRTWAMGILAAVATLFLTIGGVRYLLAGGNPRAVEEAKGSIKNAIIGYVLAALAPAILGVELETPRQFTAWIMRAAASSASVRPAISAAVLAPAKNSWVLASPAR